MADIDLKLTDELLGAYADDELDAQTRARVEQALSHDGTAAARLEAIREVTRLVRTATRASVGIDAVPQRLPLAKPRPSLPQHGWRHWRIAAAFLAGLVAMATTIQAVRLAVPEAAGWQRSALEFHARYERSASGRRQIALDHLAPSSTDFGAEFADLVDFEPVLPDLSALEYRPVGARLLATSDGPATYVVYEAPNRPIVGYSMVQKRQPERDRQTLATRDGIRLVTWSDDSYEYGLSSQLPGEDLSALADTARSSLRRARAGNPSL
jgi:anti-sigma factor RsiW